MVLNGGAVFLIAIVGSVLLHELFHLLAARAGGMRVDRYFIGFGPTIFSFRRGETTIGVKALPLGGFVRIVGMDPGEKPLPPLLIEAGTYSGTQEWWDNLEHLMRMRGLGRVRSRSLRDTFRGSLPSTVGGPEDLHRALVSAVASELGTSGRIGGLPHRILVGDEGRMYHQRPPLYRAAAILAGPLSHLLIAVLLLVGIQMVWPPATGEPSMEVEQVYAGSPAERAGLRPGDKILAAGETYTDDFSEVQSVIKGNAGSGLTLTVSRDGEILEIGMIPDAAPEGGRSIGVAGFSVASEREPISILQASKNSISSPASGLFPGGVYQLTLLSIEGLTSILSPSGLADVVSQAIGLRDRDPAGAISLVGAISIASQATSAPQGGWEAFFALLIAVNVFLMLFNLVPLPPFDGGHMAVTLVEASVDRVRRMRGNFVHAYRIPERIMNRIALPIYALLLVLLSATLWLDITDPIRL